MKYNIAFHNEKQKLDGSFQNIPQKDIDTTLKYLPKNWTAIVYDMNGVPQFSHIHK